MGLRGIGFVRRIFKKGSVCVTGLVGRGKDMLCSNVAVRRSKPYVSNIDYGGSYIPLDFNDLNVNNTYDNLIKGDINFYDCPYEDGTDLFISDGGIYLPSQYCNDLNKKYPYLATYIALSRHLHKGFVNFNVQNLNRMYDKIREMSDYYITCNWCKVFLGFVIQKITVYDKYDACVSRVKPCKIRAPLLNKVARSHVQTYVDDFEQRNGVVRSHILIYRNKSSYDTRYFKTLLIGGKKHEKTSC